ncbi:MAG: hypothetical protein KatS3mg124_2414 [Porticoccaceae bacterium]|nr:MAG: hypothetical protein KatS3mg124_2414 [Porticoccaceae bacterium]
MALGEVLDPTAVRADDDGSPGPAAGPLAGKTVGFRLDEIWRAWDWVVDLWAAELVAAGARVRRWRSHQGRTGEAGARIAQELEAFIDEIDVAVVGLGNCGSCTGWTIRDALACAAAGLPTTAVCTAAFEELGRQLARHGGRAGLRIHVLPYPLNERAREEVEAVARAHFPGLLATMGAELAPAAAAVAR